MTERNLITLRLKLANVCSTLEVCQYALEGENDLLRSVYVTLVPAGKKLRKVIDAEADLRPDNYCDAGKTLYRAQALYHVVMQAIDADDTDPGYLGETVAVLRETIKLASRQMKARKVDEGPAPSSDKPQQPVGSVVVPLRVPQ